MVARPTPEQALKLLPLIHMEGLLERYPDVSESAMQAILRSGRELTGAVKRTWKRTTTPEQEDAIVASVFELGALRYAAEKHGVLDAFVITLLRERGHTEWPNADRSGSGRIGVHNVEVTVDAEGRRLRPLPTPPLEIADKSTDHGATPMFQWLDVSLLVVDETYQRPIQREGVTNVLRIVREFKWSRFTPVIVSPLPGGKFAIIDGQHRATAAKIVGIAQVPCMVVIAGTAEQADAFAAINSRNTKMSPLAVHKASVAAQEPNAVELAKVCKAAGVKVVEYPVGAESLKRGQTLAVGTLKAALQMYGPKALTLALRCIMSPSNDAPGNLSATAIKAVTQAIVETSGWEARSGEILKVFDDIDIEHAVDAAKSGPRAKGSSITAVAHATIKRKLDAKLSRLALAA